MLDVPYCLLQLWVECFRNELYLTQRGGEMMRSTFRRSLGNLPLGRYASTRSYPIIDHTFDCVVVGAGGM